MCYYLSDVLGYYNISVSNGTIENFYVYDIVRRCSRTCGMVFGGEPLSVIALF